MKVYTLTELAEFVDGRISGNDKSIIRGIKPFYEAGSEDITFAAERKFEHNLKDCRAGAVIVSEEVLAAGRNLLHVRNPKLAFAKILSLFYGPENKLQKKGISADACIAANARIGRETSIAPLVFIGEDCVIGDRVALYPGVVLGDGVAVGEDTVIYPNVTIYHDVQIGNRVIIHGGTVIGSDGFGYVFDEFSYVKIPQVGTVLIEDEVEIGANCSVDRATLGKTIIGRGTKIDNCVQVGHNSSIGENCIIVAQVGLSGSTKIGNRVTMAGQSATNQHVTIGDGAIVTGQAGVTKNVKPGSVVSGTPAIAHKQWKQIQVLANSLPKLYEQIKGLELEVSRLRALQVKNSGSHERG